MRGIRKRIVMITICGTRGRHWVPVRQEPPTGRARAASRIAAVSVSVAGQAWRWPSWVHHNWWPLVHTVRSAVTEMTANFSAEAV